MQPNAIVYIIDNETSVRRALGRLFTATGLKSLGFGSVEEFLQADCPSGNACVICDIRLPGKSGLELPEALEKAGKSIPVIYVTAYDTPDSRSEAKRANAAGFFRKPVDDQALLDAVAWAFEHRNSNNLTDSKS